jgi:hypothetical protein
MADIVIGIASSHTPPLSSGVGMWPDRAERDRRQVLPLGKDARYHTDELDGLKPAILDYVPGYRTPAGTGTGMAFARRE